MILNFDKEFIGASKVLKDKVVFCGGLNDVKKSYYKNVTGIVVRLGVPLKKEFLSRFGRLKFVATITTSHDHIDSSYLKETGVPILSLQGETAFLHTIYATPEHTWGLILALTRKIPWAFDAVRKWVWDRKPFFGNELNGKTLGIIGYGRVGKIVSGYASAFGMRILAYDKVRIVPGGKVKSVSLRKLLSESDIISLHIPFSPETHNFIGDKAFSIMKKGVFLINTSRGWVLDEKALLKALRSGKVKGAAIDVIAKEFPVSGTSADLFNYAKKHDNLLITPHIAGSSHESMHKTAFFIACKINNWIKKHG